MDKKIYTQNFKEIFEVICAESFLHPVTALNISYTYNKGAIEKIKKNLFLPRVQSFKKQGIGSVPNIQIGTLDKSYNSIFTSYYYFAQDLKGCLHPKVYKELCKTRNNPQLQLQLLKKIGL